MKEVDLIIFDLDGTLVDSKKDIVEAVNFTLKQLGLKERPFEEVASYIGTGVSSLIRQSLGQENKDLLNQAILTLEDYYRNHFAQKSNLYPNVRDILEFFKTKTMIVFTNRKKEMALISLKSLNIDHYFKDVIGGDDENCLKPSLCSLNKALKWCEDKKRSIIVGDMDIDILAGKNAGITTCAVTYGIGNLNDLLKTKPDYVIDDLSQLKEIIV